MFKKISDKLVIKNQVSIYVTLMISILIVIFLIVLSIFSYNFGLKNAGHHYLKSQAEKTNLTNFIESLDLEIIKLKKKISQLERKLKIELASQEKLNDQIKKFSIDNSQLEEDLAFFDALMSAGGLPKGISVQRFDVTKDIIPEEYVFSLLVVNSKKRVKSFEGHVNLTVFYSQFGQEKKIKILKHKNQNNFLLKFKFFERIDGNFKIPINSDLLKINIEIFVKGDRVPVYSKSEIFNSKEK